MKTIIPLFLVLQLSIAESQIQIHDFTLSDSYGNTHHLYSYLTANNAVILDFHLITCGNCTQFAPELEQIYQNFGANNSTVKVISMEVSDTASNSSINIWKQTTGTTYPTIGGHDAYVYWFNNIKPTLGGSVNQIIAIIPNIFDPLNSYVPYIEIGIMDSMKIADLYTELGNNGYYAGIFEISSNIDGVFAYPNPANEFMNICIKGNHINLHPINFMVTDITGKIMYYYTLIQKDDNLTSYRVTTTNLQNGSYFLRFDSNDLKYCIPFQVLH